ncbi:MAG: fibronectin type III domain-containing protein, partial [Acidimicrobiales bacterium]|nr:fibronectin type III domain-containing protein [Acidimicrobiales bacterium]
ATGATAGNALWYASGTPAVTVDGTAFTGNSSALATTLGLDTHTVSSNTVDFSGWTGDISLGRFVTSTYNFQGDVQELVFTSSALSTADRQRLEGFLAHKWGTTALLPANHPYKSAPPRVGLPTAPTAVSGTGGDGAVTVQWTAPDAGYVVTDYAVQYKPAASGTWATFVDGASTATTATVTGLTAATAYEFRVAAVNAAGTSAWSPTASATTSTAWTPADLTGVALWLDAADASTTVLNGSTVSQWSDKSGNDRHAVQPTASAQPTRIASGQNGRPVLRFDGNRGLLVSAASMTLAQPFERFIAATFQTKASSSVVFDSNNTSSWNYLYNGESGDAGSWVVGAGVRVIGATADFLPHQFWARMAGASGLSSVDGASPTGPVNVGTHSLQGATIGHIRSMFNVNYGFVGDIHEVLLVSGTLADADRRRVEGYLAHRWGTTSSLPAGHPYKTAPPRVGLPTAPTAFTGQAVGETSVRLQWTGPEAGYGVTDYVVEYLPPSGSWTTFADGTSDATTATVTGLTANTAYGFRVAAVGAGGTSAWSSTVTVTPGPAWTPAALTDVAFWLDAADTSTLTLSGTSVAQWSDKSGSGNHAVQATAASRPTYDSAVQGIHTTGAVWLGFSQQVLAGTTSASMFLVGNQTGGQSSWGMMGCCGATHSPWSDGKLYDSFASSSRPGAPQALLFPSAGVRTALGYEQTGTELRFWQSGNSLGSAATTYAIPGVGVSQQRIGTMYATSYRLHEVVLVRRLLSTEDRQRLEGYLAHKWGLQAQLPANHPYKATPPYGP